MKLRDLTGMRFGRLLVIARSAERKTGNATWDVVCECGTKRIVRGNHLVGGRTASCGCLHNEITGNINRIHGLSNHRTHNIWMKMIARCHKPTDPAWNNYGGRGITVTQKWLDSFEAFVSDMGLAPAGLSIDRIDNDRGYDPGNCRWATAKEQAMNRRSNRIVEWNGRSMTVTELAAFAPVNEKTLRARLSNNWPIDRAMTEPRSVSAHGG